METTWKRTEYNSWDEAFRGLAPVIRQQSVRVAAYAQVLFVQACKMHYGAKSSSGEKRMRGKNADLVYKCGMYHQLGKALVPPEYQVLQKEFSAEEIAVYRKYTSDGRVLVAHLQERSAKAKEGTIIAMIRMIIMILTKSLFFILSSEIIQVFRNC